MAVATLLAPIGRDQCPGWANVDCPSLAQRGWRADTLHVMDRDAGVQTTQRASGGAGALLATVLVVGTDDWAAAQSARALVAAGHRVLTCHDAGEPAFPCNALIEGRTCPLDVGFDVVLTARARPTAEPTQGEMGVICALHVGAPLVSAGVASKNPFEPWTSMVVGMNDDLVEACQNAAAGHWVDLREERH